MESFAKPLRQLDEDTAWFARATELRLLHVTTNIRPAALKLLGPAIEFHPDNRSPVFVLEDAWTHANTGWNLRSRRLADDWERRVRVLGGEGLELGSLQGVKPVSEEPLAAFANWLQLVVGALRPPLEGIVVLLAPTQIDDPVMLRTEILALVHQPELAAVRWVIVDAEGTQLSPLDELGDATLHSSCIRDEGAFVNDLKTIMKSVDPEMTGPARAGAAWPRGVLPPPRPGAVEPTEEQKREVEIHIAASGANAQLAGEAGSRLHQYMLAAAIAAKQNDLPLAISHQTDAYRIAHQAGAQRETLIHQLILASYYAAAGQEDEAHREYLAAATDAEAWACPLEHAEASMALGLTEMRKGRSAEAAAHYGAAARSAHRVEATGLAIECWRLAGQMAAEADLVSSADECFHRAIEIAEGSTPEVASTSSAPRAARELARLLRARGGHDQAVSLELTANRLEEGMPRSVEELY